MSEKLQYNKDYLAAEIAAGKTTQEIGNQLRISYKLVEINLIKYGIRFTPKGTLNKLT